MPFLLLFLLAGFVPRVKFNGCCVFLGAHQPANGQKEKQKTFELLCLPCRL